MSLKESLTQNFRLKALSLLLAALLWFSVTAGQEGIATLVVPVQLRNLSPQLRLAEDAPKMVELRVSGPKLLLWQLKKKRLTAVLDLQGVGEGRVAFTNLDMILSLQQGVHIIRLYPSIIDLKVVKVEKLHRLDPSHESGKRE